MPICPRTRFDGNSGGGAWPVVGFKEEGGRKQFLLEIKVDLKLGLLQLAKADMAKQEVKLGKEELIDLIRIDVVTKEDSTDEVISIFKAIDLHLGKWREVVKACPNRTGKGCEQDPLDKLNDLVKKKIKNADYIHDYFKANKRLKSLVQYEDHPAGTVLNELVLRMILFNSFYRQDFVTIEDFRYFLNKMFYTIQEIFFRFHQGPRLDDLSKTFSSFLLAEVDKRNLNPLKQMRVIEQLRQ
ncbi:hypothetical protein Tco_1072737 [Tanacetum coccineum]